MPADEPQGAGQLLLVIEDLAGRIADIREHAVAQLQELLARRRNLDPSSEPQEQRLLELLLEQQDLPADRRLRHVEPLAGRGERAALDNRAKNLELSQIHTVAHEVLDGARVEHLQHLVFGPWSRVRSLRHFGRLQERHQRAKLGADLLDV